MYETGAAGPRVFGRGVGESNLAPVCQRDIVFRILTNIKVACTKNFAERTNLAWVLELLSWFPQGAAFDARVAARALALFN